MFKITAVNTKGRREEWFEMLPDFCKEFSTKEEADQEVVKWVLEEMEEPEEDRLVYTVEEVCNA